jgi:L,D-transpeptidase ErfK/SrfK
LLACVAPRPVHPLERDLGAPELTGQLRFHVARRDDTLVDLAVQYGVGYVEMLAANPGVDPWLPPPGKRLVVPDVHLVPPGPREGIVVNLAEMRLYYFEPGARARSYPIGIARSGWDTPRGRTIVTNKREKPTWVPGPSARREDPTLARAIPPGPDNPLGEHALYLGWPSYLIHGTNLPPGVGRHSSRGCIRLYPEHMAELYARVSKGTPVRVLEEPVKLAWVRGDLYLEVHPDPEQALQLDETGRFDPAAPPGLRRRVEREAGEAAAQIDWAAVERAGLERTGIPVQVLRVPARAGLAPPALRSALPRCAPLCAGEPGAQRLARWHYTDRRHSSGATMGTNATPPAGQRSMLPSARFSRHQSSW